MSKNKPLADNELEKAAGGQIEQYRIKYVDKDNEEKENIFYAVLDDDGFNSLKRDKPRIFCRSLGEAQEYAAEHGLSTDVTSIRFIDGRGFSEDKIFDY